MAGNTCRVGTFNCDIFGCAPYSNCNYSVSPMTVCIEFKLRCDWENPCLDRGDAILEGDYEEDIVWTVAIEYPSFKRYMASKKAGFFKDLHVLMSGGLSLEQVVSHKFISNRRLCAFREIPILFEYKWAHDLRAFVIKNVECINNNT